MPLLTINFSPSSSRNLAGMNTRPLGSRLWEYSPISNFASPSNNFGEFSTTFKHFSPLWIYIRYIFLNSCLLMENLYLFFFPSFSIVHGLFSLLSVSREQIWRCSPFSLPFNRPDPMFFRIYPIFPCSIPGHVFFTASHFCRRIVPGFPVPHLFLGCGKQNRAGFFRFPLPCVIFLASIRRNPVPFPHNPCYNESNKVHPSFGCFPSQKRYAYF